MDENNKMKGKIEEMNQDIKELKESVKFIKGEFQYMKKTLGNFQWKDLSKKFLKYFGTFLTEENSNGIRKNKNKRGDFITGRIEKIKLYSEVEKQKNENSSQIGRKSSNLIWEGNYMVHSLTVDKLKNEIKAYKE